MKKIIGIFVCMLLIITALPVIGLLDQEDQVQKQSDDSYLISDSMVYGGLAQSFKPTMPTLTKVLLYFNRKPGNDRYTRYYVDIATTLTGGALATDWILSPTHIGDRWYTFDFPDVSVTPGNTYYIILYGTGSTGHDECIVEWFYGSPDPYPNGDTWRNTITGWYDIDFLGTPDFCFWTWGETGENNPPDKPSIPTGQSSGNVGVSYTYSTSANDPEGDQVWYKWDWGNEISDWDGPYISGDLVTQSHKWPSQGTYAIKVKAKDNNDLESVWSDPLLVTMPKTKIYNPMMQLVFRILECFPFMGKILNQIISTN
jgi:hypothetical protein